MCCIFCSDSTTTTMAHWDKRFLWTIWPTATEKISICIRILMDYRQTFLKYVTSKLCRKNDNKWVLRMKLKTMCSSSYQKEVFIDKIELLIWTFRGMFVSHYFIYFCPAFDFKKSSLLPLMTQEACLLKRNTLIKGCAWACTHTFTYKYMYVRVRPHAVVLHPPFILGERVNE